MENFDKNLERLKEIVNLLDEEESIEKATTLFNEGVNLCKSCKEYLEKSSENVLKVEK